MNLKLPILEKVYYQKAGCKNIVKQLLSSSQATEYRFVSSHHGYSVIESDLHTYCLAKDQDSYPESFDYVIKVDKKATVENLVSESIRLMKWLKHPLENTYTTEQVLDSWIDKFNFKEENSSRSIEGLREPQIAALYSILSHVKVSDDMGIVVMPTGTGKTETMMATLIANRCKKVLINSPSDALREQIFNKFYSLGLLKKFGIVDDDALCPKVGIIKEKFSNSQDLNEFLDSSNVVVTTMSLLANFSSNELTLLSSQFEYIFIDEAYHSEASSWSRVRNSFSKKQILQFTATPFRFDDDFNEKLYCQQQFISEFIADISRPISSDEQLLEYIPTQIMAEFIWSRGYDGFLFDSSLMGGTNLVLFEEKYSFNSYRCIRVSHA